jgi:hypothetical protein
MSVNDDRSTHATVPLGYPAATDHLIYHEIIYLEGTSVVAVLQCGSHVVVGEGCVVAMVEEAHQL